MPVKSRPRQSKPKAIIPCQYNCGRSAEGTLMLSYTAFDMAEDSYRHGFSLSLPSCRECLKAAIRVTISIPEVAAK